ncbi:MAG: acetolactate synthase small subunit [bacterium]|nr:acetolactate synthase small subunit [bacterium]
MRHIISVLVRNHPGVLSHVVGLFTRRSYNIESLAAGVTENPEITRITIVVTGDDRVLDQVMKQVNKLVDVLSVSDLKYDQAITRELAIITVKTTLQTRGAVIEIANVFGAKVVDMSEDTITLELSGTERVLQNLVRLLKPFGISEMARTGMIALAMKSSEEQ